MLCGHVVADAGDAKLYSKVFTFRPSFLPQFRIAVETIDAVAESPRKWSWISGGNDRFFMDCWYELARKTVSGRFEKSTG